ncbi:MAG: radical SAM family heme chaperone HemW [Desulfobacterales bacterium]|nr:radical SAM family heme chaperone HemW [Desulfobacterales bacterium]
MPGIYVHVPFCRRKCPYCDFYSVTETDWLPAWLNALCSEIRSVPKPEGPYDTVYIGGGTPSLLDDRQIRHLIETLFNCFDISRDAEITMEVNPGTVSADLLKHYRAAAINRINIGVQSFDDENLGFLGRIHSGAQSVEVLRKARKAGYENIGLDLIYGLPGQTIEGWHRELSSALDFSPAHLSCYLLTYPTGTPMAEALKQNRFAPLSEAACGELFLVTHDFLLGQGYDHYEISNYAIKTDKRSRHNQKYWRHIPYIGLGPAAHSYLDHRRYWNIASVKDYVAGINSGGLAIEESEDLTPAQEMMEVIFLGLRQAEGISLESFETRFAVDFQIKFQEVLTRCQEAGYLAVADGRCALTRQGLLYADSIAAALIQWI